VAKRFGRVVDASLVVLIPTGVYNAAWYIDGYNFNTLGAKILLMKTILIALIIFTSTSTTYTSEKGSPQHCGR
jgi:uncharacterized membrane protein